MLLIMPLAALVKNGIYSKTHSGIKTQFLLNFVKTGKIGMDSGKIYADLFDWRQKGDYGDFFDFTKEDVLSIYQPAKDLIESLRAEIQKQDD